MSQTKETLAKQALIRAQIAQNFDSMFRTMPNHPFWEKWATKAADDLKAL